MLHPEGRLDLPLEKTLLSKASLNSTLNSNTKVPPTNKVVEKRRVVKTRENKNESQEERNTNEKHNSMESINEAMIMKEEDKGMGVCTKSEKKKRESLITKEYIISLLKADYGQIRQKISPDEGKPLFNRCATHAGLAYYISFNKESSIPSCEIAEKPMQPMNCKEKGN